MTRRLVLLNLLLAALAALAAWEIRARWLEARARELEVLGRRVPPAPPPPAEKFEPAAPVTAGAYLDVAQQMVFAKDRNPNVIIDEKPPEPVPPMPVFFGVMDLGGGPTAFMSDRAGGPQKSYREGDLIGAFKIAALSRTDITLEWKDKKFEKKLEDLRPKPGETAAAPSQSGAPVEAARPAAQNLTPVEVVKELQKSTDGLPGINVGGASRACAPGDTSPPGTVMGGFRKVVTATPFGQACRWEPVR